MGLQCYGIEAQTCSSLKPWRRDSVPWVFYTRVVIGVGIYIRCWVINALLVRLGKAFWWEHMPTSAWIISLLTKTCSGQPGSGHFMARTQLIQKNDLTFKRKRHSTGKPHLLHRSTFSIVILLAPILRTITGPAQGLFCRTMASFHWHAGVHVNMSSYRPLQ